MPKPKHLSQKETDDILRFFTLARTHLRLDQWDLIIMWDAPEDDDSIMDVTPLDNHNTAQIRVASFWKELPDVAKRDTCIHELIHLAHRDLTDLWDQVTWSNKGMSVSDTGLLHNFWVQSVERMVSHLTKIIADGWDQQWPAPTNTLVGKGIYTQGEHR